MHSIEGPAGKKARRNCLLMQIVSSPLHLRTCLRSKVLSRPLHKLLRVSRGFLAWRGHKLHLAFIPRRFMAERKVRVGGRNCRRWKSGEDWGVGPSSEDDRPRVRSKVRCLRPEPYREGRNEQTQALGCFHTFTLNARIGKMNMQDSCHSV